jgi:hypothetical protein
MATSTHTSAKRLYDLAAERAIRPWGSGFQKLGPDLQRALIMEQVLMVITVIQDDTITPERAIGILHEMYALTSSNYPGSGN